MTLSDYINRGALITATTWDEVGRRVKRAHAAANWVWDSLQSERVHALRGMQWPPDAFRGLVRPLENIEALIVLHAEYLAAQPKPAPKPVSGSRRD